MTNRASDLLRLSASDSEVGIVSAAELGGTERSNNSRTGNLLLYGFRDCPDHRALLEDITGVAFARVCHVTGTSSDLAWTEKATILAPQLSGMHLKLQLPVAAFSAFDLENESDTSRVEILARLDGRPWFLRVRVCDRWVYLLGIDQVPDAELAVSSAEQELPLVSAAIAILLFVRKHFPVHAWFPAESFGNFVIDDPLLRPSYGFVRHEQLAAHVSEANGAATIAFIPWNARRSARQTVELYKRTKNLSVCVHGYEHIADEFSTPNIEDLRWRAEAAMAAMRLHQSSTGVGFEPIMVFPYGRFASHAIDALAGAGFLAAVNSTFLATDARGGVCLKHLLEPAITAYGPLPLLRRRAPEYLNRFRYDVVLGKPVLLVEHHNYFSDGGAAFRQVFDGVRVITPCIEWAALGDIARRLHLVRTAGQDATEVRFYCRQFRFRVPKRGTYEFTKREGDAEIRAVRVNGRPIDFVLRDDTLRFCAFCEESDRDIDVVVETRQEALTGKPRRGRSSRLSVAARRYLSEGRENYVAANSHIRACWTVARRLFAFLME